MIEIRNLKLALSGGVDHDRAYDPEALARAVARKLGCPAADLAFCQVAKRSVDARNKGDVHFVATVHARLRADEEAEAALVARLGDGNVCLAQPRPFQLPSLGRGLFSPLNSTTAEA